MVLWLAACRDPVAEPGRLHLDSVEGNPLVPHVPAYPWPSDLYLEDDAGTATGRRLAVPEDVLPDGVAVGALDDDGFTRAPAILAWLEGGVDPASLPDLGASVEPGSPVLLLREGTTSPVPLLAEVDANVSDPNVQALILRPQTALEPSTAYVVVLRDGLRTQDGGVHAPVDAFRALRDGIPTDDPVVEGMRPDFEGVLETIEDLDLSLEEVILAWSFHTRSAEAVVDPTLAMHDLAMGFELPPWTPVSQTHDGANTLVEGTFLAPDFLGAEGRIALDAAGAPIAKGERTVDFLVTIPDTVDGPRPVIAFGHGFFSSKEEPSWDSVNQSLQLWRMSAVTVDFIGFNEDDLAASAPALGGDLVALESVVDQQLQSHVHFTLLARLVVEQLADDVVVDRGGTTVRPLDGQRLEYMGISNGGTQGGVIVACSPMFTKGTLVVPGGAWSHMMQRAVQWTSLAGLLEMQYPNPLDLQLVLSVTQQVLDPVDVINYADGLLTPFPGRPEHQVTMHMAVGDVQVANIATEWVARSAGIPLILPATRAAWGLETIDASPPGRTDVPAALFVYDENYPIEPEDNVPPATDNGAHETVRDLPSYQAQVGAFLEDGTIVQVCDGACDPQ